MNEDHNDNPLAKEVQADTATVDNAIVPERKWRPLNRIERRVVGVLIEKAKTTPDAYPMTLNSITTGCNQKSNRSPQMDLDADDVLLSLDHLKEIGAVTEIVGSGRVSKYRHNMYQWLGVDKQELAVVAELLLRGGQTLGELRARAARMEPIADINALRPICKSLLEKSLLIALTPAGRGQTVDHGLYPANERPASIESSGFRFSTTEGGDDDDHAPTSGPPAASHSSTLVAELRDQIEALNSRLERMEQRLENVESLIR